jgi:hypothetical protein
MGQVSTIGLDLAKRIFQVHGVDEAGAVVFRRQLRRTEVLKFFAKQPACLVGDRGMRFGALLGPRDRGPGTRGPADAADPGQALRQMGPQERQGRNGGEPLAVRIALVPSQDLPLDGGDLGAGGAPLLDQRHQHRADHGICGVRCIGYSDVSSNPRHQDNRRAQHPGQSITT